jgi:hypothetical protein
MTKLNLLARRPRLVSAEFSLSFESFINRLAETADSDAETVKGWRHKLQKVSRPLQPITQLVTDYHFNEKDLPRKDQPSCRCSFNALSRFQPFSSLTLTRQTGNAQVR